ncbi:MAG: hypothetical protein RIR79_1598 [Pseudomonadota bacterium]|jgi:lipopolysaccharide export system permease protein
MLFHSSIRKELARSFGATLVVLVTVVVTMTLIRTLGQAGRGVYNPSDVMMIMGYMVLSDLPIILSLSLFLAVLSVLTRMFRDSEMVIWFNSGKGLTSLLQPLLHFAWPIVLLVGALAFLILPWAFGQVEDLRDRYEKRGDISRIQPGQFQESHNGERVFFIEKGDTTEHIGQMGRNVFIADQQGDKKTVISALNGRIELVGSDKFLVLKNGQRLEKKENKPDITIAVFSSYGVRIEGDDMSARASVPTSTLTTLDLFFHPNPSPTHWAELSWRLGLPLTAINLVLIALAAARVNPRVGRTANLVAAFMLFVVYFNLLVLGKSWVEAQKISFPIWMLVLHGGAFLFATLWLAKRHNQWEFPRLTQGTA